MGGQNVKTVGIVVFPDSEELDWAGPFEVFGMAAAVGADLKVVTLAETLEPVRCAKGLRIAPDHTLGDAPNLDVVLLPGGVGTRAQIENRVLLDWLRGVAPECEWVTSVCTGAAILAVAGLVEQKRVTTHWTYIEGLRELAPKCEVVDDMRYVRDGKVVTAAGVSAGIDMSLWLVGQMFSPELARSTQKMMEYDPAPPYQASV